MPSLAELNAVNTSSGPNVYNEASKLTPSLNQTNAQTGLLNQQANQTKANVGLIQQQASLAQQQAQSAQLDNAITKGTIIYGHILGVKSQGDLDNAKKSLVNSGVMSSDQANSALGNTYDKDWNDNHQGFMDQTLSALKLKKRAADVQDTLAKAYQATGSGYNAGVQGAQGAQGLIPPIPAPQQFSQPQTAPLYPQAGGATQNAPMQAPAQAQNNDLTQAPSDNSQPPGGGGIAQTMPAQLPPSGGNSSAQEIVPVIKNFQKFSPGEKVNLDVLDHLGSNPAIQQAVTNVGTYNASPADINPNYQSAVSAWLPRAFPDYKPAKYAAVQNDLALARQTFSPGGEIGKSMIAADTTFQHVALLKEVRSAIKNNDLQVANKYLNVLSSQFGANAPASYDGLVDLVNKEMNAAYPSGSTGHERSELKDAFSLKLSDSQFDNKIKDNVIRPLYELYRNYDKNRNQATRGAVEPFATLSSPSKQILSSYGIHAYSPTEIRAMKAAAQNPQPVQLQGAQ